MTRTEKLTLFVCIGLGLMLGCSFGAVFMHAFGVVR
jgi:hypothetical protein